MSNPVFFIKIKNRKDIERFKSDFKLLLNKSNALSGINKKEFVAIKLTFGDKDNTGFVDPRLIKVLVDKIKSLAARPFLTDSNVIYEGKRMNAVDHLLTAYEHGFTLENTGAPIVIADGLMGENSEKVKIEGLNLKSISIPPLVSRLDNLIGLAHPTGHIFATYGGAIKNIAMGFASRAGKQIQHSNLKPQIIEEKCNFCQRCLKLCPMQAIVEKKDHAFIRKEICIGCGECISACPYDSLKVQWNEDMEIFGQRMVEYCYGILSLIKNKFFINFAVHITKNCDCLAKDEADIVEDIGILASRDIVALDKATLDLIEQKGGSDVLSKLHPQRLDYRKQLAYAQRIGLGNQTYQLVNL
jgi:uncharacterized Fe-S center protein